MIACAALSFRPVSCVFRFQSRWYASGIEIGGFWYASFWALSHEDSLAPLARVYIIHTTCPREYKRTCIPHTMDNKTDIDKVSQMAQILDFEVSRSSPFGRNTLGDNAYRRAERIVAALHLLTMHLSEEESLRIEIRRMSSRLLPSILALRPGFRTSGSEAVSGTRAEIAHVISLVRILAVSGLVSPGNAEALISALSELGSMLDSERVYMSEDITISREDLMPRPKVADSTGQSQKQHSLKDILIKDKRTKGIDRGARPESVSLRSDSVLSVLRNGHSLSIKDIVSNMPEYSEKMVQRTLAEMVAAGKIKKEGEKRWSRYSLAEREGTEGRGDPSASL